MATEKVARILKSKSNFSDEEISKMSDNDAWAWIYAEEKKQKELRDSKKLPEICFTGFNAFDRERLSKIASEVGFLPKESVTKSLKILVIGANAGESKISKAKSQGSAVTDEVGFLEYLKSLNK